VPEEKDEERWRTLAQETASMSRQLSDPTAQRVLLRIAEAYANLADRAKFLRKRDETPKKS
jgi:hypothetical protein